MQGGYGRFSITCSMTEKKMLKPDQPELDRQLREFEAALYRMTGRWYSPAEQIVTAQTSRFQQTGSCNLSHPSNYKPKIESVYP